MSPQEAGRCALAIARNEQLPLARAAEIEAGVAGAVDWFARNIVKFFDEAGTEAANVLDEITNAQFRRYIAWMRFSK